MNHPGVPALAGGMPASAAAHYPERLIRLKPGLPSSDGWIRCGLLPGTPDPAEAGTPVR
jgi:hypothetical protein